MADQTVAERRSGDPATRSRVAGFPVVVGILVLFQAASSAPAPLYVVYQRAWGFSAAALTLVFAVFVFGLLAALLAAGAVSDRLGRRPVLAAALALEALSLVLFLTANGVTALVAARAVQGLATGLALPTISAALVDLERTPGRAALASGVVPIGGLAVGALACGALVQYAPDPTRLVWLALLALLALALLSLRTVTETASRRRAGGADRSPGEPRGRENGGWRELVPRWSVPRELRGPVAALVPLIVAGWALGGLYLSLGPSVAAGVFGATNHLVGGLVVTALCGTGAVAAYALRGWSTRSARSGRSLVLLSTVLLAVGTAVAVVGVLAGVAVLAAAGTVVAGVGYGASGLATFGALARLAGSADAAVRGGLFAVAYTVAYLSFSLPALVAGWVTGRVGLRETVVGYAVVVILVVVAALGLVRRSAGDR